MHYFGHYLRQCVLVLLLGIIWIQYEESNNQRWSFFSGKSNLNGHAISDAKRDWKYRSVQVQLQFWIRGLKTGGGLGPTIGIKYSTLISISMIWRMTASTKYNGKSKPKYLNSSFWLIHLQGKVLLWFWQNLIVSPASCIGTSIS